MDKPLCRRPEDDIEADQLEVRVGFLACRIPAIMTCFSLDIGIRALLYMVEGCVRPQISGEELPQMVSFIRGPIMVL